MTITEVFTKWLNTDPNSCTCHDHAYKRYSKKGYLIQPYDDDKVCDRERYWRRYVELRDNKPIGSMSQSYFLHGFPSSYY